MRKVKSLLDLCIVSVVTRIMQDRTCVEWSGDNRPILGLDPSIPCAQKINGLLREFEQDRTSFFIKHARLFHWDGLKPVPGLSQDTYYWLRREYQLIHESTLTGHMSFKLAEIIFTAATTFWEKKVPKSTAR